MSHEVRWPDFGIRRVVKVADISDSNGVVAVVVIVKSKSLLVLY